MYTHSWKQYSLMAVATKQKTVQERFEGPNDEFEVWSLYQGRQSSYGTITSWTTLLLPLMRPRTRQPMYMLDIDASTDITYLFMCSCLSVSASEVQ